MRLRLGLDKWILGFTRSLSLRGKIVVLYVLILLLPTLVLSSGAVYLVIRSFHHSYVSTAEEAVQQTAQIVDFSKKSYDLLAVRTATDGELIARLGRDYADMSENVDTVNYVDRTFLITSKYLPGIADFRIYHTNGTLVEDGQLLWRPEAGRQLAGMDERAWYERAKRSPNPLFWSSVPGKPNQSVLTRKIIDNSGELLGMVYVLLNYDAVFGELLDHPFNDGSLYIVDDNRRILAATNRAEIGKRLHMKDWPAAGAAGSAAGSDALEGLGAAAGSDALEAPGAASSSSNTGPDAGTLDLTGTKDMLMTQPLSSHWTLVALMRTKHLDNQNRMILILIVGIITFFLLLSLSLMTTIVRNIVRRIRKLGTRMGDLSRGEFEAAVRYSENDELGELENRFNFMSERLGKLVEDITKSSLAEKEQAFKALQAQINPHFIYNSLGLLRWRAMDADDQEQIRIIDALTTFYRITLNNRIGVIRIRDELEHVRAYLDICQFRYPDKVRVEWDIDDEALDCYTIKTVLQPIVENCYLHGAITRRPDAVIRIAVVRDGETIRMSVFDNGQGIPASVLREIERGAHVGKGGGFGTPNIKERLALYFGSGAALTIESEAGAWTHASVSFPASAEEPAIRREA
ncbi:two-component system, sensor histidine kinase YesM [Paenibacillus sp. UNC496MF]|uniref:cache domain-containing sensor histidine kinase n=1 Tax=Paenibacillus sp. UNC496MF TaxID=1502753 RepID=UPI0008E93E3E|nr:sensor histidine kinase [Paenibacillus sp. UNC496MF]SFJ79432.1 two-component system, sensor histidine kinase YesM [Paenibacillus sp. UNC496MF]